LRWLHLRHNYYYYNNGFDDNDGCIRHDITYPIGFGRFSLPFFVRFFFLPEESVFVCLGCVLIFCVDDIMGWVDWRRVGVWNAWSGGIINEGVVVFQRFFSSSFLLRTGRELVFFLFFFATQ